ncbi:alpha/beta hydrolase [Dyella sp.]|jgi:pimeloyl-ACP methyl ester carboxylesterase|uniref:alpha/beta fold hydrolase n=1 Tax=Dyella sp. TaxID=1869338 RepID=UPI002D7728E8|nr:alpha/beta hydrolase [Dyella sp.]HET6431368.1 alpha/beta hydrolase [Dyella sp.]
MNTRTKLATVLASLLALAASGAPSVQAKTAIATPSAALHVQQHGDSGRPVILVPGLGGGAWVWAGLLPHLQADHRVYVVTLPGFDGTVAPAGGNFTQQAEDALVDLIRTRHLAKPVLVGHSLGGTLSLKLASDHPELVGGVVAVDGLPVFPGTENMTAAQRPAMAAAMQARMQGLTPAQFEAQQVGFMQAMGVIDPKQAERYGKRNAASDPKAVAQYMAEDLTLDFRDALAHASVPLLEISPYNAPDYASGAMAMSEQQKADYYRSLLAKAPQLKVVSIAPARHFVMFDQPEKLEAALDDFMARLPPPTTER